MYSTAGTIGGWTIAATTLSSNNNAIVLNSNGSITTSSGKFSVDTSGVLSATGATITGTLTATSGKIAGWTIDGTKLKSNSLVLDGDGNGSITAAKFTLNTDGKLTATNVDISGTINADNGHIGGIIIEGTTGLYDGNCFGIWMPSVHPSGASTANSIIFHAGADNTNIGGAPFRVYGNG